MDKQIHFREVRTVFSTIRTAQDKWKSIGLGLGLSEEALQNILDQQTESGKRLFSVLNLWLRGKGRPSLATVSWRTLIETLKSKNVNEKELADNISKKFHKEVVKSAPVSNPVLCKRDETRIIPKKKDVLFLLDDIAYQWRIIGEQLDVPYGHIQSISHMNISDKVKLSEVIQYWYDNSSNVTWEALISVIERKPVSNVAVANSICQFCSGTEQGKVSASMLPESEEESHSISGPSIMFLDYIRRLYKDFSLNIQQNQWPPTLEVEYINLALIKQGKKIFSVDFDPIFKTSLKGDIKAITTNHSERFLKLEDILDYDAPRKVIIVEGSPGIGKTTLACKLCYNWAMSNSLHEYWLVLYIPLRIPLTRTAQSLDDLMEYFEKDNCSCSDVHYIKRTRGKGVLVVLDGWDELRPSCRDPGMFFPEFLRGQYLPECSIIVTSRSNAAVDIRKFATRLIEILGFTNEQIDEYIRSYFKGSDTLFAEKLIKDLEAYPNVASTCYVAVNLTIVCFVYKACGCQLPSTLTEVYELFLIHAVKRHYFKTSKTEIDVCSLKKCDEFVYGNISKLARLALKSLENDELGFTKKELLETCVVDETEALFDGYGLLKIFNIFNRYGSRSYCFFLHLSIHEYLAAYAICCMSELEQWNWLGTNIRNSKFDMVFKFFCGMDQFRSKSAKILFSSEQTIGVPFALECIFEGQWIEMCQRVAVQLSSVLRITRQIEPYRALVFGYIMAKSQTPWEVCWCNVVLEEQQLRCISQNVCTLPRVITKVSLARISFMSIKAVDLLSEILKSQHFLSCLIMDEVLLDPVTIVKIFEAIRDHEQLHTFHLMNSFSFTKEITSCVSSLLQSLLKLEYLNLHGNEISETSCLEILCSVASSDIKSINLPIVNKNVELINKVEELTKCNISIEFS